MALDHDEEEEEEEGGGKFARLQVRWAAAVAG